MYQSGINKLLVEAGIRWAILGSDSTLYLPGFIISMAIVAVFLVTGILYFRKTEKTFADVI